MNLKFATLAVAIPLAFSVLPTTVQAAGGASGPVVAFAVQGQLGEIVMNPYKIAPLTAVIRNGGYVIEDASVRIVPKKDGADLKYNVSKRQLIVMGI